MGARSTKIAMLGLAGGVGTLICGAAIGHMFGKSTCINRPIGSCWQDSTLVRSLEFMGKNGFTPLMVVVSIIAGFFIALVMQVLGSGKSRSGMRFAVSYVIGMGIGTFITYYLM